MGKNKEQKLELLNAFSRMNYLYQASIVASKVLPKSILANYYGRLMKEVSKKVVEKIHPDIKRSLCSSCSFPLFAGGLEASVRVKTYKKKKSRRKKKTQNIDDTTKESSWRGKCIKENNPEDFYKLSQKIMKDTKPNKLSWSCNKCGYTRTFLQRPSHYIWVEKCEEDMTECCD